MEGILDAGLSDSWFNPLGTLHFLGSESDDSPGTGHDLPWLFFDGLKIKAPETKWPNTQKCTEIIKFWFQVCRPSVR